MSDRAEAVPDGEAEAPVERDREVSPAEEPEALRREIADLKDQLLRRRAEFENYRKRAERERLQAGSDALADFFRELIPALDNFDRALTASGSDAALRQGVDMIARQFRSLLEARGVTVESPLGLKFDPKRHEALVREPAPDAPDGTILEVLQKGYVWRDRLLRPALVKVASTPRGGNGHAEPTDEETVEGAQHQA